MTGGWPRVVEFPLAASEAAPAPRILAASAADFFERYRTFWFDPEQFPSSEPFRSYLGRQFGRSEGDPVAWWDCDALFAHLESIGFVRSEPVSPSDP
jgi:hypothetical protein